MALNKSIVLASSILATSFAFAEEKNSTAPSDKLNLDILGSVGYSISPTTKFHGPNLEISGLYSITETKIGSPVVGLGLNYSSLSIEFFGITETFTTLSLMTNFGFKFKPTEKFAIFTLANLGYGIYNNIAVKTMFDGYSAGLENDSAIKNHFIYGASLIGIYKISQHISIGAGLTYNINLMYAESLNEPGTLDQINTNLVASYSF